MAISEVNGKKGITWRVELMRNGNRIDRSFPRKKDAEIFEAALLPKSARPEWNFW